MKKLFCALLALCMICAAYPTAEGEERKTDTAEAISGIIEYKLDQESVKSVQEWINGSLKDDRSGMSEWYIIALAASEEKYSFSRCREAKERQADAGLSPGASASLRFALCLQSMGSKSPFISKALAEREFGLMSEIFALHLVTNGADGSDNSPDMIISHLLERQLPDGGWAIIGKHGDIDVTAMVMQALAPYYVNHADVSSALSKALTLLSDRQTENGAFISYGGESPEGCAQVLVALSALGIDCGKDMRFIKNGRTIIDAMLAYRLPDGSFCHSLGGESNENATAQVFYSLMAYEKMLRGEGALFVFKPQVPEESAKKTAISAKTWIYFGIGTGAVLCCALLYFRGKRRGGSYVFVLICAALLGVITFKTNIKSPGDYFAAELPEAGDMLCYISIDASSAGKGMLLEDRELRLEEGVNAYEQLIYAARSEGIIIDNRGSERSPYIAGIDNIYEFDCGELSGWVFTVNDKISSVGAGEYILREGDRVCWRYSIYLAD